ncbi:MAG: DUF4332 domain-containing protein [Candidatus Bathyarchaeota archaeon]|nr:DUF4332 domain-containing protein [Candidatus Bathyarchaeota archaeon]
MLDEEEFRKFLKRSGRSQSAIKRCVVYMTEFERYLQEYRGGKKPDEACPEDLKAFVLWGEKELKPRVKGYLWSIRYYYEYTSNEGMRKLANEFREQRIKRASFALKRFRGVNAEYVKRLAALGIRNVEEMVESGRTGSGRKELSAKTGIPLESVLEFVKLSDLARIPGVKNIRARLYYDAGVDTIEKLAEWDSRALRAMLIEFIERTEFDGIAPLPKEAKSTVATAKKLSKIVEY